MADTLHHRALKVLVIEDDNEMASFIEKVLEDAGHEVECARDGAAGLARARAEDFDALVVDRMLPEKDGLTLIREFRDAGGTTPALFLSALGDVQNKVQGLKAGAEDYLGKPFVPAELAARVEALGRRQTSEPQVTSLKAGDLEMNLLTRWDYNFDPQTNVIDVHVSRLRSKIDKEFSEPLLQTVRGAGYRLQG